MSYEIIFYTKSSGRKPVQEFMDELEEKNRELLASIVQGLDTLEEFGPRASMPLVRPLGDGIYELRSRSADAISRVFYFFWFGKKIVLMNAFVKKTQETPPHELQKAKRYKKDYEENHE